MISEKNALLILLARILDYPDQSYKEHELVYKEFISENFPSASVREEVSTRLRPLFEIQLEELQEIYVDTFDYKEKTNLYLTAHELGDSKKRGAALIQLQKLIMESGYEWNGKELADFIPMLLEFLAVAPEEEKVFKLSRRVAYAVSRIMIHLQEGNPYKKAVELLMMYAFEGLTEEEISLLENAREEADLNELPYPLMYGS